MRRRLPTVLFVLFVALWIGHVIQSGWALFAFALWYGWIVFRFAWLSSVKTKYDDSSHRMDL